MADESNKTIELDALKEDIQKLQSDLKDILHNLSTQGKEKLEESRKKLQAAMKSLKGQTEKKFDEVYDTLSEHSREAVEKGRKQIEERPLTAVFVAFIAGIVFGRLIDRR